MPLVVRFKDMRTRKFWIILVWFVVASSGQAENKAYDAVINKATRALAAGNISEADRQADTAAKLQPNNAQTSNLRGIIAVQKKDYDSAVKDFTEAITTDEKFYPAKLNLADALLLQGKYADARTRYQELQQVDAKSELLQFKIVVTDVLDNQPSQATQRISSMTFPGNTPAYYFARAALLLKNGQEKEAQQYIATAHKYYDEQQCAYYVRFLQQNGLEKAPSK